MEIAMLGWELPPNLSGGMGRHCFELSKQLILKNCLIHFFIPKFNFSFKNNIKNFIIHKIDVENKKNLDYLGQINVVKEYNEKILSYFEKNFEKNKIDIVHCHDWITVEVGIKIKEKYGIPMIFTIHSTEADRICKYIEDSEIIKIEKKGIKEADAVITVSNYMKEQLVEKFGGDPEKIFVIYNGINPERFRIQKQRNNNEKIVLSVGRLTEQKGCEYLLLAARKVLEKRKDVKFVIVGKGYLRKSLEKFSELLGIKEKVEFVGFVPDEELPKFYANSDVFVFPTVREPFGIVALEALSAGKPSIISRTAGVAEILKNNENCVLVDVKNSNEIANAIIRILEDEKFAGKLSLNAIKFSREMTWDRIADQVLNVYKNFVK